MRKLMAAVVVVIMLGTFPGFGQAEERWCKLVSDGGVVIDYAGLAKKLNELAKLRGAKSLSGKNKFTAKTTQKAIANYCKDNFFGTADGAMERFEQMIGVVATYDAN